MSRASQSFCIAKRSVENPECTLKICEWLWIETMCVMRQREEETRIKMGEDDESSTFYVPP